MKMPDMTKPVQCGILRIINNPPPVGLCVHSKESGHKDKEGSDQGPKILWKNCELGKQKESKPDILGCTRKYDTVRLASISGLENGYDAVIIQTQTYLNSKPGDFMTKLPNKSGFSRREFIGASATAVFASLVIPITGCGGDSGTNGGTESSGNGVGDAIGTVGNNHTAAHTAVVTKAQLNAGVDLILNIQGAADHNHTLSLTADDLATLKANGHVMMNCSNAGTGPHNHMVMFG
jgi:hypothetical protein